MHITWQQWHRREKMTNGAVVWRFTPSSPSPESKSWCAEQSGCVSSKNGKTVSLPLDFDLLAVWDGQEKEVKGREEQGANTQNTHMR